MRVELRGGIQVEVTSDEGKEGERVVLAIRPEAFVVEKGAEEGKNSIEGAVERVTFEGTNIRYEIRLKNEDTIVVVKPSMTGEWLSVEDKVTVNFPSGKAHVFEYPVAGLKEEIAVE
jgi:ABC-type Fe3+/spermidine/putrescine transport system ATPase subunit